MKQKKTKFFLLLCVIATVAAAGCAREGIYTKPNMETRNLEPRLYKVGFEEGFLLAVHAVELQPNWKIEYYDQHTGVFEAVTDKGDVLTVKIVPIDRFNVKIFAYIDEKGFSFDPKKRLQKSLKQYLTQLDAHLKGFDQKNL